MGCDKWVTDKIARDAAEAERQKEVVKPLPEKVKEIIKDVKNIKRR